MQTMLLDDLVQRVNEQVLSHLHGKSAHSDIALSLARAVRQLPGTQLYCSDREHFGYIVAYTSRTIFAFAEGMSSIAVRLPLSCAGAALNEGADPIPSAGDEWLAFKLFGPSGSEGRLAEWLHIAHQHALPPSA